MKCFASEIMRRVRERFRMLYGEKALASCMNRFSMLIGRYGVGENGPRGETLWDERDAVLITYGDMISEEGRKPLPVLKSFLDERLKDAVSTIHILPFFPYSSDDGFAVIDYRQVDSSLGRWSDIAALRENFRLMFDLVLNHVSRASAWFKSYVAGMLPYSRYFIEVDPKTDLSKTVRPRNLPLLTKARTRDGERHLWTTFSEDQIDLDFRNPDVLFEFLDVLMFYISKGVRIIRLDAIAYLWKKAGTSCIHLAETHEIVKLLRDLIEICAPGCIVITETNVPNKENLSYFGQGDEAHVVYQFPLAPLILHGLLKGSARHLTKWAQSLPELPERCTFLNFTASHDGIGVRPLEGIVPRKEIEELAETVRARKGFVSTKSNRDGSESPYELNISYVDALRDPDEDPMAGASRFVCSQAASFALRGIPAVYFNSLAGAGNFLEGVERTGRVRTINRKKWKQSELCGLLDDENSVNHRVFSECTRLLRARGEHRAFHPDGIQRVLSAGNSLFVVERTSPDGSETVLCISNFANKNSRMDVFESGTSLTREGKLRDVISGRDVEMKGGKMTVPPYETLWLVQVGEE